jgi:hypothetical protein
MLSDVDSESILAAGYHLVSIGKEWPPAIGTVRLTAMRLSIGELEPQTAEEAWENVYSKIQHKDVVLSDIEKQALRGVGSIYDLRRSEDISFARASFVKNFRQIMQRREQKLVKMPNVAMAELMASEKHKQLAGKTDDDVSGITGQLVNGMSEI